MCLQSGGKLHKAGGERLEIRQAKGRWYTTQENGTRKERNVVFNDPLNTFYLQLYGVGWHVEYGIMVDNDAFVCMKIVFVIVVS